MSDKFFVRSLAGKDLNFGKPMPSDVDDINEIAHALAMQCRYNGMINQFYSVAQHSVYVSQFVPAEHALTALMHDAAEIYISDIPSPLKWWLNAQAGNIIEDLEFRVEHAIAAKHGLIFPHPRDVKLADQRMLATEIRDLRPPEARFDGLLEPFNFHIIPVGPEAAKKLFLLRYYDLTN